MKTCEKERKLHKIEIDNKKIRKMKKTIAKTVEMCHNIRVRKRT